MALSDDERRVLEEMERQLRAGSSDVVDIGPRRRINATMVTLGVLVILAGIGILLGGIMSQLPVVGIGGFVAMVAGVLLATSRRASSVVEPQRSTAPRPARKSTFEERWDRRMDGDL